MILVALSVDTSVALGCEDTPYELRSDLGPLFDSEIRMPVDGRPWFEIRCGATPECTLYADEELTMPLASEMTYDGCSDSPGFARIVPEEHLTPDTRYYVDCDAADVERNGESLEWPRSFKVKGSSDLAKMLRLDDVTARNERAGRGNCRGDYLSIDVEASGDVYWFFAEGGSIVVDFIGDAYIVMTTELTPGYKSFPDFKGDIRVSLISATGERAEITVLEEDFKRDVLYGQCSISHGNRAIFGLWLLLPLLWRRRQP